MSSDQHWVTIADVTDAQWTEIEGVATKLLDSKTYQSITRASVAAFCMFMAANAVDESKELIN